MPYRSTPAASIATADVAHALLRTHLRAGRENAPNERPTVSRAGSLTAEPRYDQDRLQTGRKMQSCPAFGSTQSTSYALVSRECERGPQEGVRHIG
jgi:hypothetical protein